ncbi:maleylpyruvate isomerase family mycothiol-dependent enzyme [Kitasatospora cathayae]|uniref:Maleylpyruvate isomerase family mycothiol-dependent enzyme n=1 Tax=Kitasatospora cathayae TaxID=3004092 RepID=A0ABY7PYK1_9ACTN|nr:maleylpyruvate isomerase family mycothiol-dependent enzyme [Kitasatospora sp. HUAS 3-15]WBP85517.1 maleylpyruvate isomerase family mycothiol-dependent enzyme [Kitasatospora sp. HUAS 3-15]
MEFEELLAEVRASAARLGADVESLTDWQAREPSRLPGWSRGHVLTHLARSADAYRWMLALARTGTAPGPRADAAELARQLEEGAGRGAGALVADLRDSLDGLLWDAAELPAERRTVLVPALAGWRHPAWYLLWRAWRELEVHGVDLNTGRTSAGWPDGFVLTALAETAATLGAREVPLARVEAEDLGRGWAVGGSGPVVSGSGHEMLAWFTGRGPVAGLRADGPLPVLPAWPLPPVPGWA